MDQNLCLTSALLGFFKRKTAKRVKRLFINFHTKAVSNKNAVPIGDLSCPKNLTSMAYETQNSNYSLEYSLTKLNHSTDTGLYICQAEIYSCQSEDRNKTHTNLSISLRVYIKPNYAFHIGIISAACVLLLALLAGLVVYARKVQARSKNRYQELLATTDIQYYPSSKVSQWLHYRIFII